MNKISANAVLALALASPIAVFLFLLFLAHMPAIICAAIAVIAGWAANVAWAKAADRAANASETDHKNAKIAARFGWPCPTLFVAITWAILRFALGLVA